jgi:glycosyltransferase involved in cell wall biosynthesis
MAGRLIEGKGHAMAIEAVGRARGSAPALRLLVAGDGPLRPQLAGMGPTQLVGHLDDVRPFLAACDLLLFPTLPSLGEGFGLAALEAMACEVVPIATNEGGVPEVIDHGKTGFLANVGDIDAMSRDAIGLLSDDARLKKMGEQARAAAQARFCASKIIPMYERHYRDVLDRSS